VQTLKTAAIVVLLMTVMYGAYVSLTTPPEPLPADVQTMLDFNDEGALAIDSGLPASLGELEINSGTASIASPEAVPAAGPSLGIAAFGSPTPSAAEPQLPDSFDPSGSGGVTTTLSDLSATSVEPPAVPEAIGAGAPNYPSTGSTFDLPSPDSVASTFSPSSANDPTPPASEFALASGTSESNSPGMPPGLGDVQTADLPPVGVSKNLGLDNAIRTADQQFLDDKRRDALATLSLFYNTPNVSGEQRSELLTRLDPLAREVIYSKRHLLEQPHRVGQNETLMDIAARYEVPWQLLANINQISDPVTILPGTELKVVRGPFRAEVNLTQNELTLFLGDLYAGRFPVAVGSDPSPAAGTYTVQDKQTSKTFYNRSGSPVPPGSPGNPYGNAWLDLGSQICIHGSPSTTSPTDQGCISLAADYADDLYGILSQGSSVTIRR
jgi:lipoprotein-anchoring transpeptidase ErfK/SrfK